MRKPFYVTFKNKETGEEISWACSSLIEVTITVACPLCLNTEPTNCPKCHGAGYVPASRFEAREGKKRQMV